MVGIPLGCMGRQNHAIYCHKDRTEECHLEWKLRGTDTERSFICRIQRVTVKKYQMPKEAEPETWAYQEEGIESEAGKLGQWWWRKVDTGGKCSVEIP